MTTNAYFTYAPGQQSLVEDLTIEMIQVAGMDVRYIERNSVDPDYLFNEDPDHTFGDATAIEMYLQDVEGFGGGGEMIGGFGFQIEQTATFAVSKRRFTEELAGLTKPREGDLIFFPLTKSLFEIKYVQPEDPFFQLGSRYVWKLKCELYEFGHESFDTNDPEIDGIIANLELDSGATTSNWSDNMEVEVEADSHIVFNPNNPFGE